MAKLKSIPFKFTAQSGEVLNFMSEVSVLDSTGQFSLTIPDELETAAGLVCRSHGAVYGVQLERPRTHLKVTGNMLEGCKSFIAHAAKEHLQCEVTTEIVIVYGMDNKVAYVKDANGQFYQNGTEAGSLFSSGDAKWFGTLDGGRGYAPLYHVALGARAMTKKTYTRPSGTKTVYEYLSSSDIPKGSWLERLNGFVGLHIGERAASMQQVPYTEEAAKFFTNMLLSMCMLADRVDSFIGDKAALLAAIDSQSEGHQLLAAKP